MQTFGDPRADLEALLGSAHVTAPTRRALRNRLTCPPVTQPRYFDESAFAALTAVCARLIPQPMLSDRVDVAGSIDTRLADGEGTGWRYAAMPPDGVAHRLGMQGIDQVARLRFQVGFTDLGASQQDQVLLSIQHGDVDGGVWSALPAVLFFEVLLTGAVAAYFSHPLAQHSIGCMALADAKGWQTIELNPHRMPVHTGLADLNAAGV